MTSALAAGSFLAIVIGGGLVAFVLLIIVVRFALGINRSLQQRDEIISALQRIEKMLGNNQTKNPIPPA